MNEYLRRKHFTEGNIKYLRERQNLLENEISYLREERITLENKITDKKNIFSEFEKVHDSLGEGLAEHVEKIYNNDIFMGLLSTTIGTLAGFALDVYVYYSACKTQIARCDDSPQWACAGISLGILALGTLGGYFLGKYVIKQKTNSLIKQYPPKENLILQYLRMLKSDD